MRVGCLFVVAVAGPLDTVVLGCRCTVVGGGGRLVCGTVLRGGAPSCIVPVVCGRRCVVGDCSAITWFSLQALRYMLLCTD